MELKAHLFVLPYKTKTKSTFVCSACLKHFRAKSQPPLLTSDNPLCHTVIFKNTILHSEKEKFWMSNFRNNGPFKKMVVCLVGHSGL